MHQNNRVYSSSYANHYLKTAVDRVGGKVICDIAFKCIQFIHVKIGAFINNTQSPCFVPVSGLCDSVSVSNMSQNFLPLSCL